MKLTKCSNNHYYDADQYLSCPHCQKAGMTAEQPMNEQPPLQSESRRGFFSSMFHSRRGKTEGGDSDQTVYLQPSTPFEPEPVSQTEYMPQPGGLVQPGVPVQPEPVSPPSPVPVQPADDVTVSLQDAFRDAMTPAQEEYAAEKKDDPDKTLSFYDAGGTEPVVGWLVCVEGAYLGEGFPLKAGRNLIGRSMKMDVPLVKESGVSRERHASLIFEPKKRFFLVQPGDSSGLTYLNEELLLVPAEIHDFDLLQLGGCKLVFRSLCGPSFSWEKYI